VSRLEVLVRAADAGDTFLSWTWLRPPHRPQVSRRPGTALDQALIELNRGLPVAQVGSADPTDAGDGLSGGPARRALMSGPFSNPLKERALAETLTAAVIPDELGIELAGEAADGDGVRLRLTPSPRLARVPWELLLTPDGRRLFEVCEIVLDPPSTIYADRSYQPAEWATVRDLPVLHVIDPRLSVWGQQTLTAAGTAAFAERLTRLQQTGRACARPQQKRPQSDFTRQQLNFALGTDRSRLLYFGHVSAAADNPGTAALHLSDGPLSALELLLGTSRCANPDVWAGYGANRSQYGNEIWPMPSRVAMIACEGSVDFRSTETFGLVMAMLNAGAGLVTTTRWPLPSDSAFHPADNAEPSDPAEPVLPTTELALTVDDAHDQDDPIAELRTWQRAQWKRWQDEPENLRYSPILWAALTHTCAPRQDVFPRNS
jgi:hypothetical protein